MSRLPAAATTVDEALWKAAVVAATGPKKAEKLIDKAVGGAVGCRERGWPFVGCRLWCWGFGKRMDKKIKEPQKGYGSTVFRELVEVVVCF